jgi:hypothetical protein
MPRPAPQTKFDTLIERLNKLKLQGGSSLELEVKRLKREAEMLKTADPSAAFTTLGIIACFEGKISDMHRFHKNALVHSSEAPLHLLNYAVSLKACEFPEEALKYAKAAYEKSQTDLGRRQEALNFIINLTDQLGKVEEFFFYTDQWLQLTGKPHPLIDLEVGLTGKPDPESIDDAIVMSPLIKKVEELIKDVRE